jgi:hypothetical protein
MWAWKNPNILFYYHETWSKVGGELSRSNSLVHNQNSNVLAGNNDAVIWSSKCGCNQCNLWKKWKQGKLSHCNLDCKA